MVEIDDLPQFAGTKAFVREAGPVYAVLISASGAAFLGFLALSVADTLSVPLTDALAALGTFGFFVGMVAFGAGVLWSGMIDSAKEHHELLSEKTNKEEA